MVFILNKFNIVLSKYPFYVQSLNKDVNHILLSTAMCLIRGENLRKHEALMPAEKMHRDAPGSHFEGIFPGFLF